MTDVFISAAKRCYWRLRDSGLLCADDVSGTLKDYLVDRKLGIDTSFDNVQVAQGAYKDAQAYEPTRYSTLEFLLDYLQLDSDDVFVDYGCGKGRVICLVARRDVKKVIGVELDERAASIGKTNLARLNDKKAEAEILITDAIHFDPKQGTVFFLFNPFGVKTFEMVLDRIKQSLVEHPRKIRIAYLNARCESLIESQDWLEPETVFNDIKPAVSIWRSKSIDNLSPSNHTS